MLSTPFITKPRMYFYHISSPRGLTTICAHPAAPDPGMDTARMDTLRVPHGLEMPF